MRAKYILERNYSIVSEFTWLVWPWVFQSSLDLVLLSKKGLFLVYLAVVVLAFCGFLQLVCQGLMLRCCKLVEDVAIGPCFSVTVPTSSFSPTFVSSFAAK